MGHTVSHISPSRPDAIAAGRVPFARPAIGEAEIAEVVETLESGWLTTGARVHEFEEQFAHYTGAAHAVALNSCTAALHLSVLAAGIGPGDEVVTTPFTFCATANAVIHAGAVPVFADIDPVTWTVDPAAVTAAITSRTRALLPVHFAGRPVDPAVGLIGRDRGLVMIEDAAHCIEGISAGRKIGRVGTFTCFSFYSTKNLTTGEGGMVTTESCERAEWIRMAALHGLSRDAWARYSGGRAADYDVAFPGFKYNMMDLQAAIGIHQLARVEALYGRRTAIWHRYEEAFARLPLILPAETPAGDLHAHHLFTVLVDPREAGRSRDELRDALDRLGIATSVHFRALHLHPYYRDRFSLRRGMFPNAELVSDRIISLPLSAAMTEEETDRVVTAVTSVFR